MKKQRNCLLAVLLALTLGLNGSIMSVYGETSAESKTISVEEVAVSAEANAEESSAVLSEAADAESNLNAESSSAAVQTEEQENTEPEEELIEDPAAESEDEETVEPVVITGEGSRRLLTVHTDLEAAALNAAVWSSTNGQDDILWYPLQKQSDGSWTAVIDLHKIKHSGICHVHVYTNKNVFVGHNRFESLEEEISGRRLQVSESGTVRTITAEVAADSDIKNMTVAIWSAVGGQDDLRWYTLKKQSDGSYTGEFKISSLKHAGSCYAHFYTAGTRFVGDVIFTAHEDEFPKNSVKAEKSGSECTITAVTAEEASKLKVAVWSGTGGQDDIVWYTMKKQSDDSWKAEVNLYNLLHSGTVHAHVYTDKNVFVGADSFYFDKTELPENKVAVTGSSSTRTFTVWTGSHKNVSVAVWSNLYGQDDIKWYSLKQASNGSWKVSIPLNKLNNGGLIHFHCYADNNSTFIGAVTINTHTEIAEGLTAAQSNDQLILVRANGVKADLSMLNKQSDGSWKEILHTDATVGVNGVGPTTEWSRTTPAGIYSFGTAFGIKSNPGTVFSYTKVNSSHYWVDDVNSKYYNQFVSTSTTAQDWSSAEHLIDYDPSYRYALSINYNEDCVPGVGSAIFLHCWRGQNQPTLGCVAVPESSMKYILQNVKLDCKIIIDNGDAIKNY